MRIEKKEEEGKERKREEKRKKKKTRAGRKVFAFTEDREPIFETMHLILASVKRKSFQKIQIE